MKQSITHRVRLRNLPPRHCGSRFLYCVIARISCDSWQSIIPHSYDFTTLSLRAKRGNPSSCKKQISMSKKQAILQNLAFSLRDSIVLLNAVPSYRLPRKFGNLLAMTQWITFLLFLKGFARLRNLPLRHCENRLRFVACICVSKFTSFSANPYSSILTILSPCHCENCKDEASVANATDPHLQIHNPAHLRFCNRILASRFIGVAIYLAHPYFTIAPLPKPQRIHRTRNAQ